MFFAAACISTKSSFLRIFSLLGVTRLVEEKIAGFRWFLDVWCQPIEVFDGGCIDLVHHIVIEQQPEAMRLYDTDVMPAVGVGATVNDHSH